MDCVGTVLKLIAGIDTEQRRREDLEVSFSLIFLWRDLYLIVSHVGCRLDISSLCDEDSWSHPLDRFAVPPPALLLPCTLILDDVIPGEPAFGEFRSLFDDLANSKYYFEDLIDLMGHRTLSPGELVIQILPLLIADI